MKQVRLSLFSVPDLSIGRAPLTPQNSQYDSRRLAYLQGMVNFLNILWAHLEQRYSRKEAQGRLEQFLERLPYSELVQVGTRSPRVSEIPGARDRVAFNRDRLRITLLDGLHRGRKTPCIPAGRYSPDISHIIAKLSKGVSEATLLRLLRECKVDLSAVISGLRSMGLVEEVERSECVVPENLSKPGKERISWLGHACVLFQTRRASVCVDPFLRPHIRWTRRERETSFSDSFGDRFFFKSYGPDAMQLSPAQLPKLDAVFVTHQDIDHCNLGVLMMLPEDVPIVVPDSHPSRRWEVDLSGLIRRVLGRRRRIIRLKHGETLTVGDLRITAFPFHAEMPSSLETLWNCYLFETDRAAVACTADSAVTRSSIEFLTRHLGGSRKPWVLCARLPHGGRKLPGYRDEMEALFNFTRLWAWYVPVWDLFQPVEEPGISETGLSALAQKTNLRFYLPYAMGAAPWYRIPDADDPLHVPMANLSAADVRDVSRRLSAIPKGPSLFPGKFAEPFPIGEV
jgi:L-ascorbate metabolism protein UlaG (beta-lactamase superfamily)